MLSRLYEHWHRMLMRRFPMPLGARVRPWSLAGRLALVNALMTLLTIAIAGSISYAALSRLLDQHADGELRSKAQALAHTLADLPGTLGGDALEKKVRASIYGHDDLHVAIVTDRDGKALFASSQLAEESLKQIDWFSATVASVEWRFRPSYPVVSVATEVRPSQGSSLKAVLSQDRSREERLLNRFASGVIPGLLLVWAVLLVGSWRIARLQLAPLAQFSRMAARIGSRSLNQRLHSISLPQELIVLAEEFNSMLARIEQGMQRISHFSADIAHELRTPIGILLGRTQVALSRGRSEGELREVLESNVVELERLSRLVADMLFVAQEAESDDPDTMSQLDLRGTAESVVDFMSAAAEERGIVLKVSGESRVVANEALIQRALINLVSNAIKHADAGSVVSIVIARMEGGTALEVLNQGEPIEAVHLQRIFERFYRVDASRSRQQGGTGLGLAIVAAVAQRHGGRVIAQCAGRTTRFRLELPDKPIQLDGS